VTLHDVQGISGSLDGLRLEAGKVLCFIAMAELFPRDPARWALDASPQLLFPRAAAFQASPSFAVLAERVFLLLLTGSIYARTKFSRSGYRKTVTLISASLIGIAPLSDTPDNSLQNTTRVSRKPSSPPYGGSSVENAAELPGVWPVGVNA
jgi:hypothetical protein